MSLLRILKKKRKRGRRSRAVCIFFCIVSRTESFTVLIALVRVTRLKPGFPHYALIKETLFPLFIVSITLLHSNYLQEREWLCELSLVICGFPLCLFSFISVQQQQRNSLSYYSLCSSNIFFCFDLRYTTFFFTSVQTRNL